MKKRRRSPLFCLLLVVLLIGFAIPVRQIRKQMWQAQNNQQLVLAVRALNVSQVQECLSAGADPNMIWKMPRKPTLWQVCILCFRHPPPRPTESGERVLAAVLDSASRASSPEQQRRGYRIAVLLLHFGANPQGDDFSPLSVATWMRAPDVVKALVERGADVNVVDLYGNRPLLNAAADKVSPSGLLLLARGADPNVRRSGSRRTPLMEAAGSGNTALVRALLEKKADLTLKDARGKTALDFAREYDRKKIVALLKQAGSKE